MATTQPSPTNAAFSSDGRHSALYATTRTSPSTALLIEYFEQHNHKDSNLPSVRVRVNPFMSENPEQSQRTSYVSPLPTRENTVIDRQRSIQQQEEQSFEQTHQEEEPSTSAPTGQDPNRGRQRTRTVSEHVAYQQHEEDEEPLPALPYRSPGKRDISDPQSLQPSLDSNDMVSSRQFQAIIASAIQELILPEIQAVRNELTAQAQLFHQPPINMNQVSNQATFGTSTSGRKRSRSLTALDAPLHRRNSMSIGTTEGYHGEILPLPPRPTSPNVPAAMEAESVLLHPTDLRSELRLTPPGTAHREREIPEPRSNRLSLMTDGGPTNILDPSSHTILNLAEGAYKKRESHEEKMAAAKARREAEKRERGENVETVPEDLHDDDDEPGTH